MDKRIWISEDDANRWKWPDPPVNLLHVERQTKIAHIDAQMHPELAAYVATVRPTPGASWVVVNAMCSGEYYGPNINGDYFPYEMLKTSTPAFHAIPVFDEVRRKQEAIKIGYGFPTFYWASPYKHHVNKDPERRLGDIKCAVWNDAMRRVELLIRMDHERMKTVGADDILHAILCGKFPPVSMGCRVPYDVCSFCGHRAPTANHYCNHIRDRRLRPTAPDGQRIYMINVRPKFFDLSFVLIPAERVASMTEKIASYEIQQWQEQAGDPVQTAMRSMVRAEAAAAGYEGEALEKIAYTLYQSGASSPATPHYATSGSRWFSDRPISAQEAMRKLADLSKEGKQSKLADMIKYVLDHPRKDEVSKDLDERGRMLADDPRVIAKEDASMMECLPECIDDLTQSEPDLPSALLDRLGRLGMDTAIGSCTHAGIRLRPKEFARLAISSSGLPVDLDGLTDADFASPSACLAHAPSLEACCEASRGEGEDDLSGGGNVIRIGRLGGIGMMPGGLSEGIEQGLGMLRPFLAARSASPRHVVRRIVILKQASSPAFASPSSTSPTPRRNALRFDSVCEKIASAYNGYRLFLCATPSFGIAAHGDESDPYRWPYLTSEWPSLWL